MHDVKNSSLLDDIFLSDSSLSAHLGDAGADESEETAAAADTHADPGDEEVDVHEVAAGDLVKGGFVLELCLLPGSLSISIPGTLSSLIPARWLDITGGVLAVWLESPDHAEDPPEEATAADTAATEGTDAAGESWADKASESGKDAAHDGDELKPEAPCEPCDELAVHINNVSGAFWEECFGSLELLNIADNTVPGCIVWVAIGVLAEEGHKGDPSTAACEAANAAAKFGKGASLLG